MNTTFSIFTSRQYHLCKTTGKRWPGTLLVPPWADVCAQLSQLFCHYCDKSWSLWCTLQLHHPTTIDTLHTTSQTTTNAQQSRTNTLGAPHYTSFTNPVWPLSPRHTANWPLSRQETTLIHHHHLANKVCHLHVIRDFRLFLLWARGYRKKPKNFFSSNCTTAIDKSFHFLRRFSFIRVPCLFLRPKLRENKNV